MYLSIAQTTGAGALVSLNFPPKIKRFKQLRHLTVKNSRADK
jgi:hypothetical protein